MELYEWATAHGTHTIPIAMTGVADSVFTGCAVAPALC